MRRALTETSLWSQDNIDANADVDSRSQVVANTATMGVFYMRYSIETAPRDGKVVILEDVASVTFDVAHWSHEVSRWVDKNGEPSKIRPTHWFPLGRDKYLLQENDKYHLQENEGSSNSSRVEPSSPRSRGPFAAFSITAAFVAAALVGFFSGAEVAAYVMRYAGQQNILGVSTIGEQVAQTRLPSQDSRKSNLLALQQRAEADQAYPQAVAVAQAKQAREAPASRQSLDKEQRAEVLANELAQARRAINRLNLQLRAAAANSAELLGQEREKTVTLVQAATAARHELEEERARGATLATELAMARSETETNVALLNKARDEAVQFNQTPEKMTTELQQEHDSFRTEAANSAQLLGQERERTAAIAQEAAAARQELIASATQHHQALDEERARGADLARELATARIEIETQAAQLRKVTDETGQLKQEVARSAQSLEQERERAVALAQEAAAARQELIASAAQHRQALGEERARGADLASEFAMAHGEAETYAALLNMARDETRQLKQATENTIAELQQERDSLKMEAANSAQSLEQERERAAALAQEAAAARQELIASAAQHRQALGEERARGADLASEFAMAHGEAETYAALLNMARDETRQLKQATENTIAELQQERDSLRMEAANSAQLLGQERERTVALAQQVAAARQELTASTAQHRQALDEERARGDDMANEFAMARTEIETRTAQLRKASDETRQLEQITERTTVELQQEHDSLRTEAANSAELLGQEQEQAATLVHAATAARHELEEECARGAALPSELAMTRDDTEMLLNKAHDDAAESNQTPEKMMPELQQEHDSAEALWQMAREAPQHVMEARATLDRTASIQITQVMQTVEALALEQPAATASQNSPEAARLMVRARGLLGQGNIGAARIVLEHVAETGSAQASFALAETYDPAILFTWGTYGTQGDATKARELYAKAHAGGIREAKTRFDALDQ